MKRTTLSANNKITQCNTANEECATQHLQRKSMTGNAEYNEQFASRRLTFVGCAAGLAAILLCWPLRTHLPPTWDSIQYVLGVLHYDITMHQPQPPGSYLYVHTAKLLVSLGLGPYTALAVISLLTRGLTVALLTWWAGRLMGMRGAVGAAILALFSPLAWVYGTHGDTYAVSAFSSTLVGYLCWRLTTVRAEPMWRSAVALGLAGGFRPTDALFLFPLWLWCARRKKVAQLVVGLVILGLITAAWLFPMIASAGGWSSYRAVSGELAKWLWRFAPLLGNMGALHEFSGGLLASGSALLLAAWLFVLFAGRQSVPRALNAPNAWLFLLLWAGPGVLFSILVHFGQAGYLMLVLPPAVLVATIGLVRLWQVMSNMQLCALLILVVALNTAFTWSVLIAHERQREADMRQIQAALSQFSATDTVALTSIRGFRERQAERLMLEFRYAMYLLPHIRTYIFPLELARRCGDPPNYGHRLVSGRVEPPVTLSGVHNLLLLDPDLRQFLPPGTPKALVVANSFAHVYLVRLEPNTPLILGPQDELRGELKKLTDETAAGGVD